MGSECRDFKVEARLIDMRERSQCRRRFAKSWGLKGRKLKPQVKLRPEGPKIEAAGQYYGKDQATCPLVMTYTASQKYVPFFIFWITSWKIGRFW